MDAGRRQETHGSEAKDFITHAQQVAWAPQATKSQWGQCRGTQVDTMQVVALHCSWGTLNSENWPAVQQAVSKPALCGGWVGGGGGDIISSLNVAH